MVDVIIGKIWYGLIKGKINQNFTWKGILNKETSVTVKTREKNGENTWLWYMKNIVQGIK